MRGTRLRKTIRTCASLIHREVRIALTPLVEPDKWVFVVGCYNSGTELLVRLLSTHPAVSALPHEGQFLTDQLTPDYALGLPRMWVLREDLFRLEETDPGPDPVRMKREWLMRLDRSRPVFLEKSPPNAARTRWLQRHFPNAHFIALVRNGYAVAEGIRRKAEPHHLVGGWPLELCALQWKRSNEILIQDSGHLDRVLWVRYEDLTGEPRRELRRICSFLGLDPDSMRLDVEAAWEVHERAEPIRNMNPESISRLTLEERRTITRLARDTLLHFGYEVLD